MKTVIKIILGIIFVPLIISTGITISKVIEDGIEYVITATILEIILIWGYIKLNKKINNFKIERNKKVKIQSISKSNEEETKEKYEKITDTFWINQQEKTILVNSKIIKFSQIISAELVEESMEKNTISRMGNHHNSFNGVYGVGLKSELINKIDVEIKTNDMSNPFISIPFLKLGIRIGFYKNSKKYKQAYIKAQNCVSILQLIIEDNKKEKELNNNF